VRAFEVPTFIFPAPSQVAVALWRGFASGLYQSTCFTEAKAYKPGK